MLAVESINRVALTDCVFSINIAPMAMGCWGEDSDPLRLNVSANRHEAGPNPASRFFNTVCSMCKRAWLCTSVFGVSVRQTQCLLEHSPRRTGAIRFLAIFDAKPIVNEAIP